MKNIPNNLELPEALNAGELMWRVVSLTPRKLKDIDGIVNVDVVLTIDITGAATIASMRCNTLKGKPVAPDDPDILGAAEEALRILRFRPARCDGNAVPYDRYELSFGFTTAALENPGSPPSIN